MTLNTPCNKSPKFAPALRACVVQRKIYDNGYEAVAKAPLVMSAIDPVLLRPG